MLAARVAQECGVRLGREVGYQIRFEDVTSSVTRIRYVTEGILLRQMLADPAVRDVACIVFDEFHERHLYGDVTLARARALQRESRPDLGLIVMSATLDLKLVEDYLRPCDLLESQGRTHPVDIRYFPGSSSARPRDAAPIWEQAADAFAMAARTGMPGDALIFMPGAYETSRTIAELQQRPEAAGCVILPLHGDLPPDQQDQALARSDRRKIIVSTNVAETSLTIDGVRIVIDSGLARIARYDPHRGINTLLIEQISRASADQRAGRAGRTAPGICIRLWSETEHRCRPAQELPEIRRVDLAEIGLALKAAGYSDLATFPWVERPEPKTLERAETLLRDLGAADEQTGAITELGRRMLAFPVHPRYARMLVAAETYGGARQVALIAALTQGRDILMRHVDRETDERRKELFGAEGTSDFFVLMRAWSYAEQNNFSPDACRRVGVHAQAARQVRPLYDSFLRLAMAQGLIIDGPLADDDAIRKCILTGFADHLAKRLDGGTLRCQLVHNRRGVLARDSVVQKHPLLVAAEVNEIEGREVVVQLSRATAVDPIWLREIFPDAFREETVAVWDETTRRVYAEKRTLFRDLVLSVSRSDPPPPAAAAELLAERVARGELSLKKWDERVEQWLARINCLAAWCPELNLPIVTAEDRKRLIARICEGAVSYKDIKEREVRPIVHDLLSREQKNLLDRHAPERITLPNGRSSKIVYSGDAPPYFAASIQQLYGLMESPKIAMGRVALIVHILAPNGRPVQITQDLSNFWREHYPRIRQELQHKYPKHEWR
jgi:ATP-dependent helicase HrpB